MSNRTSNWSGVRLHVTTDERNLARVCRGLLTCFYILEQIQYSIRVTVHVASQTFVLAQLQRLTMCGFLLAVGTR